MSYPQFHPSSSPGESRYTRDGPALSGPVLVANPSSELDHAVVDQPQHTPTTRPLTVIKRNTVKPAFIPSTERSADVFVVMKALAAVGHQIDKDHDAHIRSSLTKDPHEDVVDAMVPNDQWCDILSLDEYLGY
ncbi:hypothetical protein BDQ17DRAFT_1350670 [Cyathus striatus]|nr:hypothetical protein BDQ17DRAFT_1350670 [Cyathus striatus]